MWCFVGQVVVLVEQFVALGWLIEWFEFGEEKAFVEGCLEMVVVFDFVEVGVVGFVGTVVG